MSRPVAFTARRYAGFTLIELLIVLIIVGILMAIAVPAYLKYEAAANDRDAQTALTTAYKAAVAGDTEVNSSKFPLASTVVLDIQKDEPAASVARGDCYATVETAPTKQVLVDPSSTASQLTLCTRSASGTIWRLSGPLTGTPTMSDGSTAVMTSSGFPITDVVRSAGTQGDGLPADSSTGLWESTTNMLPNGGFEGASALGWATSSASATVTPDSAKAKFGAGSLRVDVTTAAGTRTTGTALTSGTPYTCSAWVWAPSGHALVIQLVRADFATVISQTSFNGSGSWQRVSASTSSAPATETGYCFVKTTTVGPSDTFWVDGGQLEAKPFATPYVETAGVAASRTASSIHAPVALLNQKQGWFAARLRMGFPASDGSAWRSVFSYASSDGLDGLDFQWRPNSPRWKMEVLQSATGQSGNATAPGFTNAGDYVTVIGQWQYISASNRYALAASVNGSTLTPTLMAVGFVPSQTATTFSIGSSYSGASSQIDSDILWFACGTGQLTDPDAATINGWGNADPSRSAFPSAAQATMVWDGTSATGSLK